MTSLQQYGFLLELVGGMTGLVVTLHLMARSPGSERLEPDKAAPFAAGHLACER